MEQAQVLINQEFKHNFWLKTIRKAIFPKIIHGSVNQNKDGNYIILHYNTGKPIAMIVNAVTLNIEEKVIFDIEDQQHLDTNFLHHESFFLNNRIYLIQNAMPKEPTHIYIVDIQMKRVFSVKNIETKPSDFRINYTASLFGFKIIFFGGLNESMQPLNVLDSFDLSTYRWEKLAQKGKIPSPRHSHSSIIVNDKMIVMGGTKSNDLFDKDICFNEVHVLDLNTLNWAQVNLRGTVPRYMAYGYLGQISENTLLYLWGDRQSNECKMQANSFNFQIDLFEELSISSFKPEFRYAAAFSYSPLSRCAILYGGFFFDKADQNSVGNEIDRIYLASKEDKQEFEKLELYKGEKYDEQKTTPVVKKEEEQKVEETKDEDDEDNEISFEELLEREKKLEEEEKNRTAAKKRDKKKKRKGKNSTAGVKEGTPPSTNNGGGGAGQGSVQQQTTSQGLNK